MLKLTCVHPEYAQMHDSASGTWTCSLCGTAAGGTSEQFQKDLAKVGVSLKAFEDGVRKVALNHAYGKLGLSPDQPPLALSWQEIEKVTKGIYNTL